MRRHLYTNSYIDAEHSVKNYKPFTQRFKIPRFPCSSVVHVALLELVMYIVKWQVLALQILKLATHFFVSYVAWSSLSTLLSWLPETASKPFALRYGYLPRFDGEFD